MPETSVVFILGPTASGKTQLSIDLAKALNGEIISVDSALIYKDMNIGTAKPPLEEQAGIPHHLMDLVTPEQDYSVADFRKATLEAIKDIHHRGKKAILVGGTMMYFKALIEGLATQLPSAAPELRSQFEHQLKEQGLKYLAEQLVKVDPAAEDQIHLENPVRVIRALEVFHTTGKPITEHWEEQRKSKDSQHFPYDFKQVCVAPNERKTLHLRIEKRFKAMLAQGFEQELIGLRDKYQLNENLTSMRSVGYRQMWHYLEGLINYEDMVEQGIIATRQLAKRQLTWLRGWQNLHWFDSLSPTLSEKVLKFLTEDSIS